MKVFWKSKTIWVSVIVIIAGVIQQYYGIDIFTSNEGIVTTITGIVFMILRFVTGVQIGLEDIPKPEK